MVRRGSDKKLLAAVRNGDADAMGRIIARGVDVDDRVREAAVETGVEAVQVLLDHGSRPTQFNTVLQSALDKPEVLEFLIEAGADPHQTCTATIRESRATIAIRLGADADEFGDADREIDEAQRTKPFRLLHKAVDRGNAQAAAILIDAGADPNESAGWLGDTPLHVAAESGNVATIDLLLDKGADESATNRDGETPREVVVPIGRSALHRIGD